jgi:hypothetical protein
LHYSFISFIYVISKKDNKNIDAGGHVTYIFQTIDNNDNCCPTITSQQLITLIIKKDNRKKHNSHQWFFSPHGFCGAMNPEFCFATDSATQFDEKCIKLLIDVMQQEENCSVVCYGVK